MNVDIEQCDDGNLESGDGCSETCLIETILTCGDGSVNQEWEQCDDGNTLDGDGCSETCQLEIDDDIVDYILDLQEEPIVYPEPERIITPLILPKTGAQLN
jgi:cysteine-rich repeat protein